MKPAAHVSLEAYRLFNDNEWANLLRRNGIDLSRAIRYSVGLFGVAIYYDDTFIGAEI